MSAGAVIGAILLQLTTRTPKAARNVEIRFRWVMDSSSGLPAVGEAQPGRARERLVLALVTVAIHAVGLPVLDELRELINVKGEALVFAESHAESQRGSVT